MYLPLLISSDFQRSPAAANTKHYISLFILMHTHTYLVYTFCTVNYTLYN